ncbi:Fc.00g028690.m01.CDS01 [Cosmosporella sp. VM-42]
MAPITHIVLFQFKPELSTADVKTVNDNMLALKTKCIHPDTGKPYIKASSGGINNSIEGMADGITHAFVVEFESVEDRDYYVKKDPEHLAFIKSLGGVLVKPQVIDFTPGVF